MKFKITKGGTARGDESLCRTCSSGHRRRYANTNEELVYCHAMEKQVPGPVAECSDYRDASKPTLSAMREIAWLITSDKKKNFAGFLDPKAYKKAVEEGKADSPTGPLPLPDGTVDW